MKIQTSWREKMKFSADAEGLTVEMDAKTPIGSSSAMTPKELLLAAVCGCTGMDVVALLKKYRQAFSSFAVLADATSAEGKYPAVFTQVHLTYQVSGEIDPAKAIEAVTLSQTKYCSVSAMVSKAVPIAYTIEVNGREVGTGTARFED